MEAITRLPANQATAIVMRCVQSESYEVIALALGCGAASARKHVARGRERLARLLRHSTSSVWYTTEINESDKTHLLSGEPAMNQGNWRRPAIDTILDEMAAARASRRRITASDSIGGALPATRRERCQGQSPLTGWCGSSPACVAAGLAASVLLAVALVMLGGRDAWAQVVKTVQSKPWVRCKLQVPAGEALPPGFQPPEAWFSARNKIGARRFMKAAQFVDFARQETREYDPKENAAIHHLDRR